MQFDAHPNVTGIAYNPASIARHISMALSGERVDEESFIESQGMWVHTDFHSSLSHPDADGAARVVNAALVDLNQRLRRARVVFITFGTAVVFRKKEDDSIANNCHKLPSSLFEQTMPGEDFFEKHMRTALMLVQAINPDVAFYLTVSPVRHLRHGAIMNQRSKARLIRLCEMLTESLPGVHYLPVYEMAMDELRGYRFYRHDDLIHLNEAGLTLIQERLEASIIDPSALPLVQRIKHWRNMHNHRILKAESAEAKAFSEKRENEKRQLESILGRPLRV